MFSCKIRIFELGFVLYELSHANRNHIQALVRTLGGFSPLKAHKNYLSAQQHHSRPKAGLTIVHAMLWRPITPAQKNLHLNTSYVLQGNSCRHSRDEPEQEWQNTYAHITLIRFGD